MFLYCIPPLEMLPNTDGARTLMNPTFILDSELAGTFVYGGLLSDITVFSRGDYTLLG
jgi:hypothetical protein